MSVSISENLTRFRKAAGLTQEQLAEKLFVTRQAVSKWERGESQPDLDTVAALAELYGVTVDELLTSKTDVPEKVAVSDLPDTNELKRVQRKKLARSMIVFGLFEAAVVCLATGVIFTSLVQYSPDVWIIWLALPVLVPLVFGIRFYGVFGKKWFLYFINVPIICLIVFEVCITLDQNNYGAWLCFLFIPLYYAAAVVVTLTSGKNKTKD